jgi:FkbM family methyltransferase
MKPFAVSIIRICSLCCANNLAQRGLRLGSLLLAGLRGLGSGSSSRLSGQDALLRQFTGNPVIFDVGANIGQFADAVLKSISPVQLHSFEPSERAFSQLAQTIGAKAVRINQCALSDKEGEMTLYAPEAGSELASLTERRLDHFGLEIAHREKIRVDTVDAYCARNNIPKIDLLKVDVEGHEMAVFRGAGTMLSSGKIRVILFEFGGANIDTRTFFQDFYYFFKKLGAKRIGRLTPSGWEAPVLNYTEDLEYFRASNYVVYF